MFGRNKKPQPGETPPTDAPSQAQGQFDQGIDFETSRIEMVEKSERRAWKVAKAAVACGIILAIAIGVMMPLKETKWVTVRVDNATGAVDVVTELTGGLVSYEEVQDKFWLAKYVRSREGYDWYSLQQDYDLVGLLSTPEVGAEYAKLFEGENALDQVYGQKVRVTVNILSIVPNGQGLGTIRFTKTTKRVDDINAPGVVTRWVATVAYAYMNASKMKESDRLVNPFGFQVVSYRVDPELGVGQ